MESMCSVLKNDFVLRKGKGALNVYLDFDDLLVWFRNKGRSVVGKSMVFVAEIQLGVMRHLIWM